MIVLLHYWKIWKGVAPDSFCRLRKEAPSENFGKQFLGIEVSSQWLNT